MLSKYSRLGQFSSQWGDRQPMVAELCNGSLDDRINCLSFVPINYKMGLLTRSSGQKSSNSYVTTTHPRLANVSQLTTSSQPPMTRQLIGRIYLFLTKKKKILTIIGCTLYTAQCEDSNNYTIPNTTLHSSDTTLYLPLKILGEKSAPRW